MDCKTARLLLDFARPLSPELEESEGEALAGHLADCPTCGALHREERRIDERLGSAMRAVPVPDGLRDRIVGKLAKQRDRRYVRRLVWGAAAAVAASLLLVAGITYFGRKPDVNLLPIYEQANNLPERSPEKVAAWFNRPGLLVPTQLDYQGLVRCSWADFQGRKVPMLELRQGAQQAWIYILNDRQFDLKGLAGQGPLTGGYSIEVLWPAGGEQHTAFVVIFTGESSAAFLSRPSPPL
jgi:hypothetical protein